MSKRPKQQQTQRKGKMNAQWLLEGSHGMERDADAAVALLEEQVKDGDAKAMWMLGMCCEYGMGTEQDVDRANQLYIRAAEKRNLTAKLLVGKLYDWKARSCYTDLDLGCTQEKKQANNANRDL